MTADTYARLDAAYLLGALSQRARHPRLGGAPPLPDYRSLVRPPGRSPAPAYADLALAAGGDGAAW